MSTLQGLTRPLTGRRPNQRMSPIVHFCELWDEDEIDLGGLEFDGPVPFHMTTDEFRDCFVPSLPEGMQYI